MTAYRKRRERPPVIGTKETSWIFYITCYDLRLMRANIFRSWSAGMASGTGSSRRQAMSPGSIALLCITWGWLHPQTGLDRSEIWFKYSFRGKYLLCLMECSYGWKEKFLSGLSCLSNSSPMSPSEGGSLKSLTRHLEQLQSLVSRPTAYMLISR